MLLPISDNQAYLKTLGIENATGTLGTAATGRIIPAGLFQRRKLMGIQSCSIDLSLDGTTNLVGPNTASTATTALTSTETFTLKVSNGGCDVTTTTTVTVSFRCGYHSDLWQRQMCRPNGNLLGNSHGLASLISGKEVRYQYHQQPSAATQTLTLTNVTAGDADTYDVVVTATCGSPATSAGATSRSITLPWLVLLHLPPPIAYRVAQL